MALNDVLHFPEKLTVRFVDENTGKGIPRIASTLTVFAREKNDYHLGPPISDAKGEISITSSWVNNAIQHVRNSFIMDYSTPMQQCLSEISIKVMSLDDIERAISAMRLYGIEFGGPDIAHSIADLQNTNNGHYQAKEIFVTLDNPNKISQFVQIELRKV